jgi:hypothetical protein
MFSAATLTHYNALPTYRVFTKSCYLFEGLCLGIDFEKERTGHYEETKYLCL